MGSNGQKNCKSYSEIRQYGSCNILPPPEAGNKFRWVSHKPIVPPDLTAKLTSMTKKSEKARILSGYQSAHSCRDWCAWHTEQGQLQVLLVHEIYDYNTKLLFVIRNERAEAAIEEEFATGLLHRSKSFCSERNDALSKAIRRTMKVKQANSATRWATRRRLE